jgi:YggT family protein
MFILGNLFLALAGIFDIVLTVLYWLILVRALVSWVSPDPYNPIVSAVTSGNRADFGADS